MRVPCRLHVTRQPIGFSCWISWVLRDRRIWLIDTMIYDR